MTVTPREQPAQLIDGIPLLSLDCKVDLLDSNEQEMRQIVTLKSFVLLFMYALVNLKRLKKGKKKVYEETKDKYLLNCV